MGMDVLSLIIFGATIVLLILDKLPMATAALIGCTVMVATGVCKFSTAFGQFASSTVILTIGVMVIGASISESGLAGAIAIDEMRDAIAACVKPRFVDMNLAAVQIAVDALR